jgi:hypothetical protein
MTINAIDQDQFSEQLQGRFGLSLKTPAKVLAQFYAAERDAWEKDYVTYTTHPDAHYSDVAPTDTEGWRRPPSAPSRTSTTNYRRALAQLVNAGLIEIKEETRIVEESDYSARKPDGSNYAINEKRPTKNVERTFTYYRLAPRLRESKTDWLEQYRQREAEVELALDQALTVVVEAEDSLLQLIDDRTRVSTPTPLLADLANPPAEFDGSGKIETNHPYFERLRHYARTIQGAEQTLRHQLTHGIPTRRATLAQVRAFIERLENEINAETGTIEGEAVELSANELGRGD